MATTLTITLTDAQWSAYQAVADSPSTGDVEAWLKKQLTADYDAMLLGADQETQSAARSTANTERASKVASFSA